jgi:hypothetical protein
MIIYYATQTDGPLHSSSSSISGIRSGGVGKIGGSRKPHACREFIESSAR